MVLAIKMILARCCLGDVYTGDDNSDTLLDLIYVFHSNIHNAHWLNCQQAIVICKMYNNTESRRVIAVIYTIIIIFL